MKRFFDQIRDTLFRGRLTQQQVDGIVRFLDYRDTWNEKHTNLSIGDAKLAYILATVFHETAYTMQPAKEIGSDTYLTKRYDITGDQPHIARRLGNHTVGDGLKYPGRGYVPITGKSAYTKASDVTGVDLVNNPEKLMNPATSVQVAFHWIMQGWFTGKALNDYLNDSKSNYINARMVVADNGKTNEHAHEIAQYAEQFHKALQLLPRKKEGVWKPIDGDLVRPMPVRGPQIGPETIIDPVLIQVPGKDKEWLEVPAKTVLREAAELIDDDHERKTQIIGEVAKLVPLPTGPVRWVLRNALPFLLDQLRK